MQPSAMGGFLGYLNSIDKSLNSIDKSWMSQPIVSSGLEGLATKNYYELLCEEK